jgi:cytochrome c peroxidase
MRVPRRTGAVFFLALAALVGGCDKKPPALAGGQVADATQPVALGAFAPLPDAVPPAGGASTAEMENLGRLLFFEPRLSKSQKISCNTCHDLAKYGVDGEPTSDGHMGQKGDRNSPTVYNSAAHFAQFWDGRAATVEDQAKGPVLNPVEMAMPAEPVVVKVLESMPEYVQAFARAFPGEERPVTYDNMARAIGAFERRLMTPSRWDALLKGDKSALTPAERLGLKTYTEAGCQTCHAGALLGGTFYQRLGVAKEYPRSGDPGRAKVTNNAADRGVFKVPSLRNVEKTGPYFHDGETGTLELAVREMAEYQLGKTLTDEQTAQIVDFLKALTGKIDPEYIKPPVLPESTAATPKADEST